MPLPNIASPSEIQARSEGTIPKETENTGMGKGHIQAARPFRPGSRREAKAGVRPVPCGTHLAPPSRQSRRAPSTLLPAQSSPSRGSAGRPGGSSLHPSTRPPAGRSPPAAPSGPGYAGEVAARNHRPPEGHGPRSPPRWRDTPARLPARAPRRRAAPSPRRLPPPPSRAGPARAPRRGRPPAPQWPWRPSLRRPRRSPRGWMVGRAPRGAGSRGPSAPTARTAPGAAARRATAGQV